MNSRRYWLYLMVFVSMAAVWPMLPAEGTVSQIDGTILPDSNNLLQGELEWAEGITDPADPLYLDATRDAYTFPQIFLPPEYGSGQPVVFTDIAEHAGFENTFGWYNVGDTSRLYKVLECSDEGRHDGGPTVVSVDFDAEFDAGRWDGGFIGFYLITPEDNVSGVNCGDNNPDDFGHIYYSEAELNGDGDYVHHLVYTSKIDPNRFYFAFEDLFRGGDNDFSDMTIRVEGLTPPCVPEPEVCDDMDNDCDGDIDEEPLADTGGSCGSDVGECQPGVLICENGALVCDGGVGSTSEVCDGLDNDCDGTTDDSPIDEGGSCGTNVGECSMGTRVCQNGALVCDGEVGPQPEVCDGLDNDCNGSTDDNVTDDGATCGVDEGECQSGVETCVNGSLVCQGEVAPSPEVCDGLDNDCNGSTDDSPIDSGGSCGTNVGECEYGVTVCQNGALSCENDVGPTPEVCNGLDDDCNGTVDDNPGDAGGTCGSDEGECQQGTLVCSGGALICQGAVGAQPEVCDGLDNDCNGSTDDNPIDAGSQCGVTVGECEAGQMVCVNGTLTCEGAVGPQPEVCDGADNDCNGDVDDDPIDEGGVCGTSEGQCEPGTYVCSGGGLICEGQVGPQPEICDGLDNDCDGVVDNDDPGGGGACGITDEGVCELGVLHCVAGSLSCVGGVDPQPETCDCLDNDCNGQVDDGAECPEPFECIDCECRKPCDQGEFACPGGMVCEDGYCVPTPCYGVECPPGETCVEGECVDICDIIECEEGETCSEGRCVEDNCYGLGCPEGEVCLAGECRPDPCAEVSCGEREFCRNGECIESCERVDCLEGQTCRDGQCVDDPCAGVECAWGRVCSDGTCIDDPCEDVSCGSGRVCEGGECVDDPCAGVTCPLGGVCEKGQCEDPEGYVPGSKGKQILSTGAGGCSCRASSDGVPGSVVWVLFGLLALTVISARRRGARVERRRARSKKASLFSLFFICLAPGLLLQGGCDLDPHQFPDVDGYMPAKDGGTDAETCEPTNGGVEICDNLDNDCDGQTDEEFELQSDPENCGACGNDCSLPGAFTDCREGSCVFLECKPGYHDINADPADGCEHYCVETNDGAEACDELDNDCDGLVDEGFDLMTDPVNCGSCGVVCAFTNGTGDCQGGECVLTDCLEGFLDLNGITSDGCEYACQQTNGGVEICDGLDNDCNGSIDDGADTSDDPLNCGACGNVCARPNATMDCVSGACVFIDCDVGHVDANQDLADGCEYACEETNGGAEICDGIDNDCDGTVDDDPTDAGGACGTSEGECEAGVWACSSGSLVCSGGLGPQLEVCDGFDNDCDGETDNAPADAGGACGTGVGECQQGTMVCVAGGSLECQGGISPTDEVCDGFDNDCDGIADNHLIDVGDPCGTDVGECEQGVWACSSGSLTCSGQVSSQPEMCDGFDNDCDGQTDEDTIDTGDLCGTSVGLCETGVTVCENTMIVCQGNVEPDVEICDNHDNDCNGVIDDNTQGEGVSCGVTDVGPCELGIVVCDGGSLVCEGNIDPEPSDVCDGVDNDCDGTVDPAGCVSVTTTDVRLDDGTNPGEHNSVGVDMAASGDRIHVVWLDHRSGYADIYHTCSADGGQTWIGEERLDSGSSDSVKPRVIIAPTGWAYVAYEDFVGEDPRQIFLRRASSCAAGAFEAPVRLDDTAVDSLNIDLAADGSGNLYVVWEDFIEGSGSTDSQRNIYLAASSDSGASFSASSPARVNQVPSDPAQGYATTARVAVGASGRCLVTWMDKRDGASDIYLNRTDDHGATFLSSDVSISTDSVGAYASKFPRIAVDAAGNGVVVWQDLRSGYSDIYYNYSTDNGVTWQATDIWLDSDKATSSSYDADVVMGSAGWVHVAWQDFREGLPHVRVASSSDGGATFGASVRASRSAGSASEPRIAANGAGKVFVGFACDPDGLRDVYVNYSLNNGAAFQPEDLRMDTGSTAGQDESFTPRLAVDGAGGAFTTWVDTRATGQEGDIYFNFCD